jgi:hypothetical protein
MVQTSPGASAEAVRGSAEAPSPWRLTEPLRDDAKGRGSSGGATAPPLALLPSTTKKSHVGRITQRPISTTISEASDVTASSWSVRMPQLSRTGRWSLRSSGPSTRAKTHGSNRQGHDEGRPPAQ